MKVLCLHGQGLSGLIMERQLADFCRALNPNYDYVFLDGEIECRRAHALSDLIPGPFHCYHNGLATTAIREAQDLLSAVIAEEGPFDGVIGFSQGAALALSYLLQHEIERPHTPPPFKWAVFFGMCLAASSDPEFLAADINDFAADADVLALMDARAMQSNTTKTKTPVVEHRIALALKSNKRSLALEIVTMVSSTIQRAADTGLDSETYYAADSRRGIDGFPRVFHPLALTQRVSIPTVHVVGRKDDEYIYQMAKLMRKLCKTETTRWVEHSGGHDVPRGEAEVKAAVDATQWAIGMSRLLVPGM